MSAGASDAAPDLCEPFEAWRVWRVVGRGAELMLASVVKRSVWMPREPLVAECLRGRQLGDWLRRRARHAAPTADCECGIYATTFARARGYLEASLPCALGRVIGPVALWGVVAACKHGFRASHAYPLALYLSVESCPDPRYPARAVASRLGHYGVPVELLPSGQTEPPVVLERAG